ncbi:MAG: hypothetical protein NTY00_13390 [Deltaproteobacteria bacterium]|nr:hypothetical protein [Deltaproteobacteria bacterium]
MKKFGVTVVKGMVGVGILILAFWGYQSQQSQGIAAKVSEQKARLRAPLAPGNATAEERPETPDTGRWLAGDFHNHTFLTDGSNVPDQVFAHAFQFGLDWIANSEHGGAFSRNSDGQSWPTVALHTSLEQATLGHPCPADTVFLGSPPAGKMWRWQSLWQYSYPLITKARTTWPDKLIIQGYEWNVPGHDHASVAIVGPAEEGGLAIARHEYLFDDKDSGTTADNYLGTSGKIIENNHAKAVAGVRWLNQHYPQSSYFLINHPSRWQNYSMAAIRDFHDAAPSVAFGFEGMPGHQKASQRGHYDGGPFHDSAGQDVTFRARTYGGADYMLAKVGGAWDALLGEDRRFFVFVNSDFHTTDHDFWPGEYAKNHTYVQDLNHDGNYSADELIAGLRSGNSFIAQGDLIDSLQFSVQCQQKRKEVAAAATDKEVLMPRVPGMAEAARMGGNLEAKEECDPQMTIRFRSPSRNNNGDTVAVDHIDLIAGEVREKAPKVLADGVTPNPDYEGEINTSTRIMASFTRKDWKEEPTGQEERGATGGGSDGQGSPNAAGAKDGGNGWQTIVYQIPHLEGDMYFRLRGTNLGRNVKNETDGQGNPLNDDLLAPNTQDKAYADLWFYSNPIFVRVAHPAGSGLGVR